jgi:hypothetical protein
MLSFIVLQARIRLNPSSLFLLKHEDSFVEEVDVKRRASSFERPLLIVVV